MTTNGVHYEDSLITVSNAPGYRDVGIELQLMNDQGTYQKIEVRLDAADSQALLAELLSVHRLAWRGGKPIDVRPGEVRPVDLIGS
jgi:hypothetical protein